MKHRFEPGTTEDIRKFKDEWPIWYRSKILKKSPRKLAKKWRVSWKPFPSN